MRNLKAHLLPSLSSGRDSKIESHHIDVSTIREPEVLRIDDAKGLWKKTDKTRMEEWKRKLKCKKCWVVFDSYKSLVNHQSIVHSKFNCYYCSARFGSPGALSAHLKTHNNELPPPYLKRSNHRSNLCHHCGGQFDSSAFTTHLRSHTGEKPFICAFCAKAFASISGLRVHERTHADVKPYKCGSCVARFANKHSLLLHRLIHTGEKPHKCTWCNATFNQAGNLRAHTRRHTGEKPFKCDQCGACFAWNVCLKTHRKNCRNK